MKVVIEYEEGFCGCAGCATELVTIFANRVGADYFCRECFEECLGTMFKAPSPAKILGRLGGLKGGPARVAKLGPERVKEIAKKAAMARWAKKEAAQ